MKRPAIFFDRDNTLIVCDGYLGDPAKVVLVDGAADAIARASQLGYAIVIFSNQSGVGRGMFTEEAVHAVNDRLDELLAEANPGAIIDRHEFCPFHPEASVEQYRKESSLRKPAPGMILQAAEDLALDLSRSWVIGDTPRDIEAGKAAGCRTILFQDPALPASTAQKSETTILPDHFVQNLRDALKIIETATLASPSAEDESMPASNPAPAVVDLSKLENLLDQVLEELRKPRRASEPLPQPVSTTQHFSISKMVAGIVQVLALAVLVMAYFSKPENLQTTLLLAIMMQAFTIALLIMGRQH